MAGVNNLHGRPHDPLPRQKPTLTAPFVYTVIVTTIYLLLKFFGWI